MYFTEQQYASLNKIQLDESWKCNLSPNFSEVRKMDALRDFFVATELQQNQGDLSSQVH